jgi:hypothetical protein
MFSLSADTYTPSVLQLRIDHNAKSNSARTVVFTRYPGSKALGYARWDHTRLFASARLLRFPSAEIRIRLSGPAGNGFLALALT